VLRWLKTVVVSDPGKGALDRQVGTRKTFQKRPIMRSGVRCGSVVSFSDGIEIEGRSRPFEMSLAGVPSTGQAVSGVEAA